MTFTVHLLTLRSIHMNFFSKGKWKSICEILQDFKTFAISVFTVFVDAFDIPRRLFPRTGTLFTPPPLCTALLHLLFMSMYRCLITGALRFCSWRSVAHCLQASAMLAFFLYFSWNFAHCSECTKSQKVARVSDLLDWHNVRRRRRWDT